MPTLAGKTTVTIPPGSSGGQKLRLRGKGVKSGKAAKVGDMFLKLKIVLPKELDEQSRELLEEFARLNQQDDIRDGLDS